MKKFRTALIVLSFLMILFTASSCIAHLSYTYVPRQTHYLLYYEARPVHVYFFDAAAYQEVIKKYFGFYYEDVMGLTLTFRKSNGEIDRYEIYLPYDDNGAIDLEVLGHELAHIFDKGWHL